ncbi:hypothetical protein PVAP13_1KG306410 [Panicum virgatum]|uniref:C2 domain-containing protein n=1 Tax=Panicum virgatum TaxID=38727 RepID=A0A8T0XIJ1_PANVG|nr:hypothetical protein PVAP13_1KG306410 [Panicum virgatum]
MVAVLHAAVVIDGAGWRACRARHLLRGPDDILIRARRAGLGVHGAHRPHRVKTPTDRAGGGNPEWDAPLRLYLPDASPSPPPMEVGKDGNKDTGDDDGDDVLLLRFELKVEVAVLGDKLATSTAVPVRDLVADGQTRQVSYQLSSPDGRQPNGIISFSYALHDRNRGGGDGDLAVTPLSPTASSSTSTSPGLYPAIDQWPLADQIIPMTYPPPIIVESAATLACSLYYPPSPPATLAEPVAVYPPPLAETSSACSVYPPVPVCGRRCRSALCTQRWTLLLSAAAALALYDVGCGYAAAPGWDDPCLYG